MWLCICRGLNSEQLKKYISEGDTWKRIVEKTGATQGCGSCLELASEEYKRLKNEINTKHVEN